MLRWEPYLTEHMIQPAAFKHEGYFGAADISAVLGGHCGFCYNWSLASFDWASMKFSSKIKLHSVLGGSSGLDLFYLC